MSLQSHETYWTEHMHYRTPDNNGKAVSSNNWNSRANVDNVTKRKILLGIEPVGHHRDQANPTLHRRK